MSVKNKKYPSSKTLNHPIIDILEIIKQPLVIIDDKCYIRYANPAYYNFFKTFKEVTENCNISEISNGDWDMTDLSASLKQSFAFGGRLEKFEVSQKFSRLGHKKIVLDMLPVPGQSNSGMYMLSFDDVSTETTDLALQSIMDTVQNLVYIYDLELNKLILINKKSLVALDYTAAEVQEAETDIFTQQLHPDDLGKMKNHRQAILQLQDGETATIEYRIQNQHGKWIWYVSTDLVFKRDKRGKPIQYVGIATDISEILDANKILASKNAALENSNNELYSFSSIASHDLKEPLRKIQLFGNFILDDAQIVSESSKRYLSRMILAANRMQKLIDDLINYSRADFDKSKFINSDLNLLLDEVSDELKDIIEESETTIEISKLGTAAVLPSQFRQLFINLISNSIKYCKKDCPATIRIFAREAPIEEIELLNGAANEPFTKITIEDNGIGFDNAYKTKIFEPFQRLHTRSDYSGTGIGLSICKKIVENHKGFITAESTEGKGTRLDIYIPSNI